MGQTATIAIQLDDPNNVIPGVLMSGKVYLDVKKEKVDAESLMIRFVGGEYTVVRWTEERRDNNNKTYTVQHTAYSTSIFLDLAFPLCNIAQGFFVRGQYEFPFSFVLPAGVYPSMRAVIPGSNGGSCSVRYNVEARLHRRGWFKWDVSKSKALTVLGRHASTIPKCAAYIPPEQQRVAACCCFGRGNIKLGMYTPNSVLAAGEVFDVSYVVENNSHATIKAIEIMINETVSWTACGRQRTFTRSLFKKRLNTGAELVMDLTPLKKRPEYKDASGKDMPAIDDLAVLKALKEALDSRKHIYTANIANTARTTMNGRLIDVKHTLTLKICTTFGTNNPVVNYPLTIHRYGVGAADEGPVETAANPVASEPEYAVLPSDWRATVYEAVAIPEPYYVPPTVHDVEGTPEPKDYSPSAPMINYIGTANLFTLLANTYDVVGSFEKWLQMNDCDAMTVQDFRSLFGVLRNGMDQVSIADRLGKARTFVTCAHIAEAIAVCKEEVKVDVVMHLASKVNDKDNRNMLKQKLTDFQFICIEQYFV